jgi:Protein of unknown function (DUF2971)
MRADQRALSHAPPQRLTHAAHELDETPSVPDSLMDHPLFGFDAPADPDRWVFHYTRLERAQLIAASGTLRLSPMSSMNDPREFRPPEPITMSIGSPRDPALVRAALDRLTQRRLNVRAASFTADAADGGADSIRRTNGRGYARPTMWAHYGDTHHGVCLAMNRQALTDSLVARFGDKVDCRTVRYSPGIEAANWARYLRLDDLDRLGPDALADQHFTDNVERLLFEKNNDWRGEREWRCCVDGQVPGVDAELALVPGIVEGIVVGIDFPAAELDTVERIAAALSVGTDVAVAYLHQMNVIDVLPINTDVIPWRYCTGPELQALGYAGAP